jgi:hypothetical protein
MIDRIQATSTLPLADHLTEKANRDPLPVATPKQIEKADNQRLEPSREAKKDSFEDYLDQSSILHLEEQQKSSRFDPVAEMRKNSVYIDPGQQNPI